MGVGQDKGCVVNTLSPFADKRSIGAAQSFAGMSVHARAGRAARAYWTTVTSSISWKKNYPVPIKHKFLSAPHVPGPPVRWPIHCSSSPFIRLKNIGWSNEILKASTFVHLKITLLRGGGEKKPLSVKVWNFTDRLIYFQGNSMGNFLVFFFHVFFFSFYRE